MSTLAAGPACRFFHVPLVDGTIQTGAYRGEFLGLNRLGMSLATLVVANTAAGLAAWGVSAGKGRVVYNGFDTSRLPAAGDRRRVSHFTVVMTARMEPEKHYEVVLAAARRLATEGDWRFVLIGQGSERARIVRQASDLLERGVVECPEPGMEVLDQVRQADVGILMTNPALAYEGLSNSILEYMALGLPVVCGAGGGNPELVIDGVTGFIVPPGDARMLAERLSYLRAHQAERHAMGVAGQARVAGEFSVAKMVAGMVKVYEEAILRTREGARRARKFT